MQEKPILPVEGRGKGRSHTVDDINQSTNWIWHQGSQFPA